LAVSLAAQDSLKNLIGSLTILTDSPFRIGDRIVCSGYDGFVEDIGFRSTTLRTLAGHRVSIPNANIVSGVVENISRRPAIRRSFAVLLTRNQPAAKVEEAIAAIRAALEAEGLREPLFVPIAGETRPPQVFLSDFQQEGYQLTVTYWYSPPDMNAFAAHAEQVNLMVCRELERLGVTMSGAVKVV
jgi:MscS family membrane protein